MAEAKPALIQFRPSGLEVELQKRGDSMSTVAKRDLDRYYDLLERSLASLSFTYTEAVILMASLKDIPAEPRTSQVLAALVRGELRAHRKRWDFLANVAGFGIENAKDSIDSKLDALTRCEAQAIMDAVERFHKRVNGRRIQIEAEPVPTWNGEIVFQVTSSTNTPAGGILVTSVDFEEALELDPVVGEDEGVNHIRLHFALREVGLL